ncbi:hypothetical protein [Paenibacillus thermotolerans]|uniref:hypothetical protein n=1 Tax=Paenibacillus thermotolerans TaxID=3027807 RepID=UPI0023687A5B|nr:MULTISPECIES: hypothetical protein [unclassified Paenibacillus]
MEIKEKLSKIELKQMLKQKYPHREALIKRIETVYVPVRNAQRTKEFFMKHKLVTLSKGGNAKLASGQGIFFLETNKPYTLNFETHDWIDNVDNHLMEAFCFEVGDIATLYEEMKKNGALVSELRDL